VSTQAEKLLAHIRREIWKSLEYDPNKPGWDPDEAYETISRIVGESVPPGAGIEVIPPSREKLVALRLMGKDIRNTLHLDIEFKPIVATELITFTLVLDNKTL
jgi:hypothetical protein